MKEGITKYSDTHLKVPKPQDYEYLSIEDIERRIQGRNEIIQNFTNQITNLEQENTKDQALLDKATDFDLQPINNVFKKEE